MRKTNLDRAYLGDPVRLEQRDTAQPNRAVVDGAIVHLPDNTAFECTACTHAQFAARKFNELQAHAERLAEALRKLREAHSPYMERNAWQLAKEAIAAWEGAQK
jgi:hypothetical protein